jgi:hypothetical protein
MKIEIGIRVVEVKVIKVISGDIDLRLMVSEMQTIQKHFRMGYATVTLTKSAVRDWLVSKGVLTFLTAASDVFRKGDSFDEIAELLSDELYSDNKEGYH